MTTRKDRRIRQLSTAIAAARGLHIKDAADLLGVSEMTVRRDIRDHPGLFAYFGGHIVPAGDFGSAAPYELAQAAARAETEKHAACQHCLALLRDGDTIFVDCGTTLPHLIDQIPGDLSLQVICYAFNIADRVTRRPNLSLILLGGVYHPASASFAALPSDPMLHDLSIDIAFLSAAGLDARAGATCISFHEAQRKRAAMARAQRRVLVIDSGKLGRAFPARFAAMGDFDTIITESGPVSPDSTDQAE